MAIRHLPCSIYDFPAMETWLSDMAARGLHLNQFWGSESIATFNKGRPERVIYRLEPADKKEKPDEEQMALFTDAGWAFVTASNDELVWVFRASRPDPVPIHTDPETQAVALEGLRRRLQQRVLWSGLTLAAMGVFYLWLTVFSEDVRRWILNGHVPNYLVCWLFYFLAWMVLPMAELPPLKRLIRSLAAGVPMEHRGRYGWRRWAWWGLVAVLVCGIFSPTFRKSTEQTYELADCPVAYVSLKELGAGEADSGHATWTDGVLADRWTVAERRNFSSGTRWWQGTTHLYQADVPGLAGPLVRDILRNESELKGAEKLPDSPFDQAWYIREGDTQSLLARQGRRVLWVLVDDGSAEDLRDHLAAYQQVLAQDLPRERGT